MDFPRGAHFGHKFELALGINGIILGIKGITVGINDYL